MLKFKICMLCILVIETHYALLLVDLGAGTNVNVSAASITANAIDADGGVDG